MNEALDYFSLKFRVWESVWVKVVAGARVKNHRHDGWEYELPVPMCVVRITGSKFSGLFRIDTRKQQAWSSVLYIEERALFSMAFVLLPSWLSTFGHALYLFLSAKRVCSGLKDENHLVDFATLWRDRLVHLCVRADIGRWDLYTMRTIFC